MTTLNPIGQRLATSLAQIKQWRDAREREASHVERVNVVGAGSALTAAYEQLRNAAENTEEHLLLQNAVKRFYKQLFVTRDEALVRTSGNELAIELTFAGYVPNDSLTRSQLDNISNVASRHYVAYEILQKRRSVPTDHSSRWILDSLAVEAAAIISEHHKDTAFMDVAYHYFEMALPPSALAGKTSTEDHAAALFCAIHKALLKSDNAAVRSALLTRYQVSVDNLDQFVSYNQQIDRLLESQLVDQLYHAVDRQGAPLRIIRRMIESNEDFVGLLRHRERFLDAFEKQVTKEYASISARINRAIIRSVVFLIITKFLIGIAIEVPYDLWAHGKILWQPLLINLFFPPLYMIALRLTQVLPGYANTSALVDRADTMLYGAKEVLVKRETSTRRYSSLFSIIYVLLSILVFAAVIALLLWLGFSFVHIVIFFIFISAASFLGFRLSRLVRELEVVRSSSNGLTFVRDVIYLPFVVVGQWMSDKYSKVNIVTLVLDMMIELPLKTVLRLVRQWGAFIDDRKDRI